MWLIINKLQYLGGGGKEKDVFKNADIFVFPMFYECECFPLVLLEAMSHQLPCVTTSEGGICDIIENGATEYVCPQKDSLAIASALEKLIFDRALSKAMGEAGYRRLMERFTESAFEERIMNIMKDTIESSKTRQ